MSKRPVSKSYLVVALGLVALGGGAVSAQQGGDAPPASASDQVDEAQSIVSRGERLSSQIATMLATSTREKDVIRVNCLNDKLNQVNAHLTTSKERLKTLRSQTDALSRTQTMTVVSVLGQNFQVLEQEASQCTGQNVFEVGATTLELQTDTALVPLDSEVNAAIVPDIIPVSTIDSVQTETPPPPEEASGKS